MKNFFRRLGNRLAYLTTYHFFKIVYKFFFRIEVIGRENIPRQGPCLLSSNHASFLDPPILGTIHLRESYSFARSSLMNTPFKHWYFTALNCIPVDRDNPSVAALRTALKVLKDGHPLIFFPEGTRSETGELQEAKLGVGFLGHRAGVPIIPIYIHGAYDVLPKGSKFVRFKKIRVKVGAPLYFQNYYSQEGTEELYQEISNEVMKTITSLKNELLSPANPANMAR